MEGFYEKLTELAVTGAPFVSVIMVDAQGSVPQNAGAKMLVTDQGLYCGTVGGGKVEKRAIEEAQILLHRKTDTSTHFVNWALDRDIGMTCGGSVKLYFEAFNLNAWQIVVFGAGHCCNSLMKLLVDLDCKITCIDPRQEWLDKIPHCPKLTKVLAQDMPAEVAKLSEDSFVLLMTMGHTTDKPILLEILRSGKQFPYIGVIGSNAKAARLKKDVLEAGLPASLQNAFYCPMGLDIGNNHPQEIAISIAAQLMQKRDVVHKSVANACDAQLLT